MKVSRVLRIMSVLAVFAAIVLGPHFAAARDERAELLKVRESVWHAWFVNDAKALEQLVPPGTIVISSGEEKWKDQTDILRSAAEFPKHRAENWCGWNSRARRFSASATSR